MNIARNLKIGVYILVVSSAIWAPFIYLNVMADDWILSDGGWRWLAAIVWGIVWLVTVFAFTPFVSFPGSSRAFQTMALLLALAGCSGWFLPQFVVTIVNCDSLAPHEKVTMVRKINMGGSTEFETLDGKNRFSVSQAVWNDSHGMRREARLYKGKLGIAWCTFREQ